MKRVNVSFFCAFVLLFYFLNSYVHAHNVDVKYSVNYNKNIKDLLLEPKSLDIIVHYMGWWGGGDRHDHMVAYKSTDVSYIRLTIQRFKSLGVSAIAYAWFGEDSFSNASFEVAVDEFERHQMQYLLVVDRGAIRKARSLHGSNLSSTDIVIDYLRKLESKYFKLPNYYKKDGRPVVFEFGLDEEGPLNWGRLIKEFPSVSFIRIHKRGFQKPGQGAFHWVLPPESNAVAEFGIQRHLMNLREFLTEGGKTTSKLVYASALNNFDDEFASWNVLVPRRLSGQCGRLWLKGFEEINAFISAGKKIDGVQLITWNDYDEGSELELGIDPCVHFEIKKNNQEKYIVLRNLSPLKEISVYKNDGGFRFVKRVDATSKEFTFPCHDGDVVKISTKPLFWDAELKVKRCE